MSRNVYHYYLVYLPDAFMKKKKHPFSNREIVSKHISKRQQVLAAEVFHYIPLIYTVLGRASDSIYKLLMGHSTP